MIRRLFIAGLLLMLTASQVDAGFVGYLKQSAAVTVQVGPFIDSTDGNTEETGLTISQADVRLSKNGAAFAQKTESTACSADALGYYRCPIDTTDTGTLGLLRLVVHESGTLLVDQTYMVVTANVYDSLFSTDILQVDLTQIGGAAVSATTAQLGVNLVNIAGSAVSATTAQLGVNLVNIAGSAVSTSTAQLGVNAVQIGAAVPGSATIGTVTTLTTANPTVASVADAVWDELRADHTSTGTFGQGVGSVQGNVTGSVASVAGNVGGAVVGAVGSVVGNVSGNVVGSVGSLGTQAKLDVNAEVLDVVNTDTVAEMSAGAPPSSPTMRQVLNYLYRAWRNKSETTSGGVEFYADDGTTAIFEFVQSDDGTKYTKGEIGSP